MDLFEKYTEELKEDVKLDRISLLEKQLMLPAIKHKWVARLIQQKREKNNLLNRKKTIKDQVLKGLMEEGIPQNLPKTVIDKKVENSEACLKIDEEIKYIDIVVEYLEKVESVFRSMTYDIKNAVELEKLETT
jgi:hypothetical protein